MKKNAKKEREQDLCKYMCTCLAFINIYLTYCVDDDDDDEWTWNKEFLYTHVHTHRHTQHHKAGYQFQFHKQIKWDKYDTTHLGVREIHGKVMICVGIHPEPNSNIFMNKNVDCSDTVIIINVQFDGFI